MAETDQDQSFRILDAAVDSGINLVDTANFYGGRAGLGATERCIGEWLRKGSNRRDRVVLSTKVFAKTEEWAHSGGLNAISIRREIDQSLIRLRTDRIVLLQLHHVDRSVPWEELWQALDLALTQGKIAYVGSSNFAGWHIAAAQGARRGGVGLVSEQSPYNLLNRAIELEVIPAAQAHGMAVLAWSPIAGGALAGAASGGEGGRRNSTEVRATSGRSETELQEFFALARTTGVSPPRLALEWLLRRPGVHGAVVGPRTASQLEELVKAVTPVSDDETDRRLDQIFPGFQQAPEHYAW